MEVYVVNYNDSGVYGVYTNKEDALNELWREYVKEVLPNVKFSGAKVFIDEDIKTLTESDYILDFGYIETSVIYGLEEKTEPAPTQGAYWEFDDESYEYICTGCHEHSEYSTPYCPQCGAKILGMIAKGAE